MKRLSLLLWTFCSALILMADPIGKQAALYTAQSFMTSKGKQVAPSRPSRMKASGFSSPEEAEEGQPYYYVFNAGGDNGYVIVSGDDRTEPILGYVDQGSFDPENIPENMKSWLQLYADQIKFIVDNNIDANSPLLKKRNKANATKHSIAELLTTRWNQGHPYNLTCPNYYTDKDNDVHKYPAAGCVATAMSQVIYFYKYPEKTKAIIPAHSNTYKLKNGTEKTVTLKAIPRNTVLDWENMRDTYNCNDEHVHDRADTAVANLMLYLGQAVKMGYGASSGASTSRSRDVFVNYFGFNECAHWGGRGDFSIDEWFDMIYDEINAGYPVLFAGHSSGGGHAFVLDGFDGDNLFHVNWGWGGGSNGWFLVSILNPGDNSGIGASSSSDGYSMSQGALFGLRLPGKVDNENASLKVSDVKITGSSIKATFTNKTGTKGTFNVAIVTDGEDGEPTPIGNPLTITSLDNNASQTKTISLKGKLPAEGTYWLSPASKLKTSSEWKALYKKTGQYIEAVVDSVGDISMQFRYPTTEIIKIDTIVFPGTRIQKTEQEVKVTFRSEGKEYFKTVYLLASKTQTKTYTDSKSMVAVRSGETVDVSYFFTPDTTGTYNLWLATDDKGTNVIGQGQMEVIKESEAVKANLSVTAYNIANGSTSAAYGKRLVGKASIKNNAAVDFHGKVKLQIWRQPNGQGSAWSGSSHTYEVGIMKGKVATVDFEFTGLNEGDKYYISANYVGQEGRLTNGGVWDLGGWMMTSGILNWKTDGTIEGKAYSSSLSVANTICGFYADCKKIARLRPNKANPNAIYAFAPDMEIPSYVDTCLTANVVSGNHSFRINMFNDKPFYVPVNFDADSASFTFTFPETEDGTRWHAFTLPFKADSIYVDEELVSLNDSEGHFWIYEYAAQGNNGEVVFAPAKELKGSTPYIIAADATMAGRSVVFRALNVPFFKAGSDKMVVTSPEYKFHGSTLAAKVKDCYVLNGEGTAFEYVTKLTTLSGLESYFTTTLPDSLRLESIVLPDIPVRPVREVMLDEASSAPVIAGTYDILTLKRTFEAGWNTICLPFKVDDIAAIFGEEAKAYEFCGLHLDELECVITDKLAAGRPYIIYVPNGITEDIVLNNVVIDETNTQAGAVDGNGVHFYGTYSIITADELTTTSAFRLTADGRILDASHDDCLGYRALFKLREDVANYIINNDANLTLHFYDDPTSIESIDNGQLTIDNYVYDLQGRKIVNRKSSNRKLHGVYIKNGKKILIRQ